jgi:hypothetical protein
MATPPIGFELAALFRDLASHREIRQAVIHRIRHGSADYPRSITSAPDLPPDPFRTEIAGVNACAGRP